MGFRVPHAQSGMPRFAGNFNQGSISCRSLASPSRRGPGEAKVNWLQFFATVMAAWAWPAVVVAGVWLFRNQVGDFLRKFSNLLDENVEEASLGARGASIRRKRMDVRDDLDRARQSIPQSATPDAHGEGQSTRTPSAFEEEISMLASINPAAAISAASAALEVALRDALEHAAGAGAPVGDVSRMTFGRLIHECERLGLLDRGEAQGARYLSDLRNTAVHQGVATESQALEFADMAIRLAVAARLGAGQAALDFPEPL